MRTDKKLLSLFVVFVLVVGMCPIKVFAASSYSDVRSEYWAHNVIARWSGEGYGVLQGDGKGHFFPEKGMTLGELVTVLSKVFGYQEEVEAEVTPSWADDSVEKAIAAGIIEKADKIDASVYVTREQAIKYIAMAYQVLPVDGETSFADNDKIGKEFKPYINAFRQKGYVVGKPGNVFEPQAIYTRAEAMQVLENTTGDIVDKNIEGKNYEKSLIVRKKDVTVKNTSVRENIIIGQGVEDGDVSLENVKIDGALMIYGTDSASAEISIQASTLKEVEILGNYVELEVAKDSSVEKVTVKANHVIIRGDGKVSHVYVTEKAKQGVEVLTVPTKITVDKNAGAVKTRNGMVQPGKTYTTYRFSTAEVGSNSSTISNDDLEVKKYTVSFDLNYQDADSITAQTVREGESATQPTIKERENFEFVGWFEDKNEKNLEAYFDFNGQITKDTTLYAKWIDIADTDNDKLANGLEEIYGTDIAKADTDEDGLNDFMEVSLFKYSPILKDSDNNGIEDGQEDPDGDKISNLEELQLDTGVLDPDTDKDGLLDGDEVKTHRTNPLEIDTDGDEVSDAREIELNTDPLTAESDFDVTYTSKEEDTVTASVDIVLKGEQVETLSVEPSQVSALFPENTPGYMGKAYDFNVSGEFEEATIKFEFDPNMIGNGEKPSICYFDEEKQELIELETTVEGNVASAKVSHFSTYVLMNRKVYEDSLQWEDVWDSDVSYSDVQIVFVIDDSGSMDWNDPNYQRLVVARDLIDKLPQSSEIGIVRFMGENPEKLTATLTRDKENAKSYLTRDYFNSPGGTDMYAGINTGFELFTAKSDTTLKILVVLSDGETDDTNLHEETIQKANEQKVRIYSVGLGSSSSGYFESYMKPLSEQTNGLFYLAADASELAHIYQDISKKIDLEADADGDGIPDYYEDHMVSFAGYKIPLDKTKRDTDGDGLADGEEVEIELKYSADRKKVYVKGKLLGSNPVLTDSDQDGYMDNEDLNPLVPYKIPIILLHGLNDNTTSCFGVSTLIEPGMNTHYGSEYTKDNKYYYMAAPSHRIVSVSATRLGGFLQNEMGYQKNKTLFAFNYPNHDVVQYNGRRLQGYINSLISYAQTEQDKEVVEGKFLFATKAQKAAGEVKFILVGHSMGGLVSRFYNENIGTDKIERIITIDTPHYGSGLADISDALGDIKFSPAVFDLNTDSALYGGHFKTWTFTWGGIFRKDSKYALEHQSPAFLGNSTSAAPYYAIGGYAVGRGWIGGELGQLAPKLRDTFFSFEFTRNIADRKSYDQAINQALSIYSFNQTGQNSYLDLGNSDGDDTVDYQSQFAIRFKRNKTDSYQRLVRTIMVVDSTNQYSLWNPFHNGILKLNLLYKQVRELIND
ncbi:MAG: VWA domain-containing protein [Eubacteriales bacterium]|nr:VWA domain-containing protein [Eubacteriales bacterium]